MNKIMTATPLNQKFVALNSEIQDITRILFDLAQDDKIWWKENTPSLVCQPLNSLKKQLELIDDKSLSQWDFSEVDTMNYSSLDPIESITWLVSLCRLDNLLIDSLPRRFVEQIELEWPLFASNWLDT